MIYTNIKTKLGMVTASGEKNSLTGIWFENQKYYNAKTDIWTFAPNEKIFKDLEIWFEDYFNGKNPPIEFELKPLGSEFQKKVWDILLNIPYGEITTYGEIAKAINIKSSQAVGGAVGHNPISILIPCHRVIGKDRSLTGYAGGFERKKYLLKLEGINIDENRNKAIL